MAGPLNDITVFNSNNDGPYKVASERWYKSYPYGFSHWAYEWQSGNATETFWLPINPQNINVTTHFATNIITTLYGVVEEHSEVRYYDIEIKGNTGIAPRFTVPFNGVQVGGSASAASKLTDKKWPNQNNPGGPSVGRKAFEPAGGLSLGGFLPEITNTIQAASKLVTDVLGGPSNPTGIEPHQSGYYAFHNFYKFLLRYKIDTARAPKNGESQAGITAAGNNALAGLTGLSAKRKQHPLQFLNYKDNIKYDCIPISFTLTRSAENPMLYNYHIRLRAYNLRNVEADVGAVNIKAELGLNNLSGSLFSNMAGIAGNASTLISGIGGVF